MNYSLRQSALNRHICIYNKLKTKNLRQIALRNVRR